MAAQGKYKQVNICKLKVLGKGWLLPNIQSRKHLAFAAPEGEEKMLSKSLHILCKVSSVQRLNAESQVSWTLPSVILRRLRAISPCPHHFNTLCIPLLGVLVEDEALCPFLCSEQIQSDCKGCCFHPERADVHVYLLGDCAWQKACSVWV